jgi:MoxR-like ATPase
MSDTSGQADPRLIELFGLGAAGFSAELLNHLPLPWDAPPQTQKGATFSPPPYLLDKDLAAAAWVALLLRQPLLLTGDPGVGKTRFAEKLASDLQVGRPTMVQVKSTTSGRDLLYKFDDLGRFRDATIAGAIARTDGKYDAGKEKPLLSYVRPEGLGRAILRAAGAKYPIELDPAYGREEIFGAKLAGLATLTLGDVFPDEFAGGADPRLSVVLIDELDKAPRDTPNDLLGEIERMSFRFDELGFRVTAAARFKPIVVITSNAERNLPDAFLRRCVFHHIATPGRDDMCRIAAARLGGDLRPDGPLITSAWELFERITQTITEKKPGTAEFIALVAYLRATEKGGSAGTGVIDQERVSAALRVFAKSKVDLLNAASIVAKSTTGGS